MKNKILFVAFFVQFFIIGLMFFNAYLPVFFGKEIKIQVTGYDPRDLISGNYIFLHFEVQKGDFSEYKDHKKYFVIFEDYDKDGIYETSKIRFENLEDKPHLEFDLPHEIVDNSLEKEIKLNAFKYFTTKEKAEEFESKINSPKFKAIADIKIYKDRFRIVDLNFIDKTE